jgi:hypothetical protein
MPVFNKDKKFLLYIHVPKAGGTSMEMLFQQNGWRIEYLDLNLKGKSFNHVRICSPQHMHAEMLQQQLLMRKLDGMFMTTRHPYARFRSEYCYCNKSNCDTSAEAVETWARKIFKAYSKDNFILDNHIRPQHEFYVPGTKVYKLERGFKKVVQDLAKKYKIELAYQEMHEMSREKESGFSSSDAKLNDTVKSMLNIRYQQDFRQFGYAPDMTADATNTFGGRLEQKWFRRLKPCASPKWFLRLFRRH